VSNPAATGAERGHIDLHAHTTASDGTATPEQFVAAAIAAQLSAVAVTDHDTVASVEAVTRLAGAAGIRVVPGVELSVHDDNDREVHLLGLHIADLALMEQTLIGLRDARRTRAVQIVEKLNALGIAIAFDDVLAQSDGAAIGRPHVARALVKAGHAKGLQEAFDRWLGGGKPAYVDKQRLRFADGIDLVHRTGGIAVYAHPGSEGTRERIEPLVGLGLDGVEVRHPSHGSEDIKRIKALVNHFGLVPSGGSDWHGAAGGPRVLGCMKVNPEWLDLQLARVAAQAA
jgi:predicted metal-dependent phosphoesterase TrpH